MKEIVDKLIGKLKSSDFRWLFLVTVLGFLLRSDALGFGLPNESRPDEYAIAQIVFGDLLLPSFTGKGLTLTLSHFNYMPLYFYIVAAAYSVFYGLGSLLGRFSDWQSFYYQYQMDATHWLLLLRWVSVVAGTLTIPAVYLLARRWAPEPHRKQTAFYAAILMAGCYLAVRNSHFGSVDTLMVLMLTVSLWRIFCYLGSEKSDKRQRNLWLTVASCGLTIGLKQPGVFLLIPLWVALWFGEENPTIRQYLIRVVQTSGMVLATVLLACPALLLNIPGFWHDLTYESGHFLNSSLPGVEPGWLFYPKFALFYGAGGYALVMFLLGLLTLYRENGKRFLPRDWVLLSFLLGYFLFLCPNMRVMTRYALPLVPALFVFAAYGISTVSEIFKEIAVSFLRPAWLRYVPVVILAIVLFQPLSNVYGFNRVIGGVDTRTDARHWILANVPPKQPIATGMIYGRIVLPPVYGQLLRETWPLGIGEQENIGYNVLTDQFASITSYREPMLLRQLGVRYVVLYIFDLPLFSNTRPELAALQKSGAVVFQSSSLANKYDEITTDALYDPMDAMYLPFAHFEEYQRPGPRLLIFDLENPPPPVGSLGSSTAVPTGIPGMDIPAAIPSGNMQPGTIQTDMPR